MNYLNIPSSGAITKAQAYAIAKKLWGVHSVDYRRHPTAAGISWQGNHGAQKYALWADLPAPTKAY